MHASGTITRFDALAQRFSSTLAALAAHVDPAFVRADWEARNDELTRAMLPRPRRDFLRHPVIRFQMFVDDRYVGRELPYVLERLPAIDLLAEDPVGDPPLTAIERGPATSSNTVHHLHHLLRFADATARGLSDLRTIVEWGAGYGNLAKLAVRLHEGEPTVVLFDTPVFSAIQWLYLSAVLGDEHVVLHTEPGEPIIGGAVNIAPIGLAAALEVEADLFISTWALNESTPAAQELVRRRDWFGAEALLIAMHRGDPLESAVLAAGARPIALGAWMPGQHYFVR